MTAMLVLIALMASMGAASSSQSHALMVWTVVSPVSCP